MECLICLRKIKTGEQIFWGTQMTCCGPGEMDCSYLEASDGALGVMGAMHLSCLQSPAAVVKTPNTEVPGVVMEESSVVRSDALALFDA